MRITYYHDDTIDLDLERLCVGLNDLSNGVRFDGHNNSIHLTDVVINDPKSYNSLDFLPD